ncbi:hypothetical protein DFH06DRAFT_1385778 [Mycena polygramma]|nr:hypothetical protein DFH06DRAFT_1385778 [Mycena polygramma]
MLYAASAIVLAAALQGASARPHQVISSLGSVNNLSVKDIDPVLVSTAPTGQSTQSFDDGQYRSSNSFDDGQYRSTPTATAGGAQGKNRSKTTTKNKHHHAHTECGAPSASSLSSEPRSTKVPPMIPGVAPGFSPGDTSSQDSGKKGDASTYSDNSTSTVLASPTFQKRGWLGPVPIGQKTGPSGQRPPPGPPPRPPPPPPGPSPSVTPSTPAPTVTITPAGTVTDVEPTSSVVPTTVTESTDIVTTTSGAASPGVESSDLSDRADGNTETEMREGRESGDDTWTGLQKRWLGRFDPRIVGLKQPLSPPTPITTPIVPPTPTCALTLTVTVTAPAGTATGGTTEIDGDGTSPDELD